MKLARRSLLQRVGRGALAGSLLPWLESEAEAREVPRRFLVFYTPHGMTGRYPEPYAPVPGPSGRSDDFAWSEILAPLAGGYAEWGRWIEDQRGRVLVTQGIDLVGTGTDSGTHGNGAAIMLTGAAQGSGGDVGGDISVDQRIAHAVHGARFDSLQLAVRGAPDDAIAYSAPAVPLPNQVDPGRVFERLYGPTDESEAERAQRRARQGSILDRLRADLLRIESRVGSADRMKIQAHLEGLRAMERRVLDLPAPTCTGPEVTEIQRSFAEEGRLQMDLLVSALRCDLTRVATLMWGRNPNNQRYSFLPNRAESLWPYHEATHDDPAREETHDLLLEIAHFHVRQFAYLVQSLADEPEGSGSMLDHTVILWISETSNPYTHSFRNMPIIVAGGGRAFRLGHFLRFPERTPHTRLLRSLTDVFGVEPRVGLTPGQSLDPEPLVL